MTIVREAIQQMNLKHNHQSAFPSKNAWKCPSILEFPRVFE
jgi:hypothetical protein